MPLAIGGGMVAAVAVLASWPGAWAHAVTAMRQHPVRPLAEWATPSIDYLGRTLWPLLVPGVAGLAAAACRRRAELRLALAVAVPLAVVQVLSRFKAGGTNSNWIALALVLLPLALAALARDVRRPFRRALLLSAMVAVGVPLAAELRGLIHRLPAEREAFARQVAFLAERFPEARVLASGEPYHALREAGLRLETESEVVSHYLLAGESVEAVEAAIAARHYDVIILDAGVRKMGADRRMLRWIRAHYREARLPPDAPFQTLLIPRLR